MAANLATHVLLFFFTIELQNSWLLFPIYCYPICVRRMALAELPLYQTSERMFAELRFELTTR